MHLLLLSMKFTDENRARWPMKELQKFSCLLIKTFNIPVITCSIQMLLIHVH